MTELARPGGAVLEQGEAQEWVELGEEEWVAPERVQDPEENAFALNAGRVSSMKWASPVIIGNAQNVGQKC